MSACVLTWFGDLEFGQVKLWVCFYRPIAIWALTWYCYHSAKFTDDASVSTHVNGKNLLRESYWYWTAIFLMKRWYASVSTEMKYHAGFSIAVAQSGSVETRSLAQIWLIFKRPKIKIFAHWYTKYLIKVSNVLCNKNIIIIRIYKMLHD